MNFNSLFLQFVGKWRRSLVISAYLKALGIIISGNGAHAEGQKTFASATSSHAEGYDTQAAGRYSHASGWGTYASGNEQFVMGRYNSTNNQYALIIGNGTGDYAYQRKTIFAVDWNGNIHIPAGKQVINDL